MNEKQIKIIESLIKENVYYGYAEDISDINELLLMMFKDDSFGIRIEIDETQKLTFKVNHKDAKPKLKPLPRGIVPKAIVHHAFDYSHGVFDDYRKTFTIEGLNFYKHKRLDEYARDGTYNPNIKINITKDIYKMYHDKYLERHGDK
ncbi:hypothetical protein [Pseudobutyrivibrio sp.]